LILSTPALEPAGAAWLTRVASTLNATHGIEAILARVKAPKLPF
jgi:hypothetical protein